MGLIIAFQDIPSRPDDYQAPPQRRPSLVRRIFRSKKANEDKADATNNEGEYFAGAEKNPSTDRIEQAVAELPVSCWIRRFALDEPKNVAHARCIVTAAWTWPGNLWHFDCTLQWYDLDDVDRTNKHQMRAFMFNDRVEHLSRGQSSWGWPEEWVSLGIDVAKVPGKEREGPLYLDITDPERVSCYQYTAFIDEYLCD